MDRTANLSRLGSEQFDLVIIGGGITGACLAYDATLRGLKTALIEKGDFGHATSASSSKLLHGGIRFLQQLRVDKVRESAYERIFFQNLVPHLCRYVPFVIPTFPGLKKGKAFLGAGALAYSVLTTGQNRQARFSRSKVQAPRIVGRRELDRLIPWLGEDFPATGGLILPECHMQSSERMTLAIVKAAAEHGCAVANYVEARRIEQRSGSTSGVSVRSGSETFVIEANAVANCAGPWLSSVDGLATGAASGTITSFSRGSHLVLRDLKLDCALALPTRQKIQGMADRGGRHVFLIPWRGHLLLGTSYAAHSRDLDQVEATADDRDQLIEAVNTAVGSELVTHANVAYSYSGIYPLTATDVQADVYQGASDYIVTDHAETGGPQGYFSLFGAKFTTARKLAEVAADKIAKQSGKRLRPCQTRTATVPDAEVENPEAYWQQVAAASAAAPESRIAEHLFENYGKGMEAVLEIASERGELAAHLSDARPNLAAEAVYCARHEMVEHLDDFVFRRTGLGTIGSPGSEAIERCAALIGAELRWDEARRTRETATVVEQLQRAGPANG